MSNHRRLKLIFESVKNYYKTLNIFRWNLSTDPHEIETETTSTRLLIVLFILSIVILTFYLSLAVLNKIVIVQSPSFADYNRLVVDQNLVQCPCSNISIPYGKFIQISADYHQICQSDFVQKNWIAYISYLYDWAIATAYDSNDLVHKPNLDFLTVGGKSMVVFFALCRYVNETVRKGVNIVHNSSYVSTQMISERLFLLEINSTIDQFIQRTIHSFVNVQKLIQTTTSANALQTVTMTDSYPILLAGNLRATSIYQTYGDKNCSCQYQTADCYQETSFYRYNNGNQTIEYMFSVDSFYAGCYLLESLRHSTLQFFYNQTTVDHLPDLLNTLGYPIFSELVVRNSSALNSSLNNPTETFGQILDRMMVDRWNRQISYQSYFVECNPITCTYTKNERNAPVYIVTTLFGLIGGILSILRITVLPSVQFVKDIFQPWLRRKLHMTVTPITTHGRSSIPKTVDILQSDKTIKSLLPITDWWCRRERDKWR